MNENEIYEILSSFKQAIDVILERLDQMDEMYHQSDERVDKLEQTLFKEILEPAQDIYDQQQADQRFEEFNDKYGEKLGSYNDALAPMEEEGFDLSRSAFDAYDSLPEEERPDEAAYVDEVARVAEEKISEIKRALGVPEDTAVEITDDGEGNVEVVADEDGDGEPETPVTEESTEESTETEEKEDGSEEEKDDEEDEEVVDDPEEIKKFEDEIRKSL